MNDWSLKKKLDAELETIRFTEEMQCAVQKMQRRKKNCIYRLSHVAAAVAAFFVLSGVAVFAGHQLQQKISVNEQTLPALDDMGIVKAELAWGEPGENGIVEKVLTSYDEAVDEMKIQLLDSELAAENPYMQVKIQTDCENYCFMQVENYILGDTSNHQLVEGSSHYNCDPGKEYDSTITLDVDMVFSEEQLSTGWEKYFHGLFEYVESYQSDSGYQVNIVQDAIGKDATGLIDVSELASEKYAVFVADGVRYILHGRVSVETLKMLVDSMK